MPASGRATTLFVTKAHSKGARSMKHGRSMTFAAAGALLLLAALAVAGCGGGSNASSGPPKTASGGIATVGLSKASLGSILVNSQGRTLYLFTRDSGATSNCSGACAVNWPPLRASGKPTIGSGAKASLVSTTTRSDGARQLTYNGHPLYLFKGDKSPGRHQRPRPDRVRRQLVRALLGRQPGLRSILELGRRRRRLLTGGAPAHTIPTKGSIQALRRIRPICPYRRPTVGRHTKPRAHDSPAR